MERLDDRRADLLERAESLLVDHAYPLESRFFAGGIQAVAGDLAAGRAAARRRGLWVPHLPPAWGGVGLGLVEVGHLAAVLGKSPLGHYLVHMQAPDAGNQELLLAAATPEQQAEFLAPLSRGDVRSCFALTEPDRPGSNPTWLATVARRDGGDYLLSGRKWFTSSADGAGFAVVAAVTDADAEPHRRASLFLVPLPHPGVRLVRNVPVMGEAGGGWASHGELEFAGCRVPERHRLGAEGEGFALAQARLGPGRIHHCMRWIGVAERAFELMCRRAASRRLAPDRRLGDEGIVAAWIAESRAALDASRLLVLDTARRLEHEGLRATRDAVSLIKFHVAGVMNEVLDRAIQVHGALGMTDDTPLAWFWRHERAARIYDGPDEVHKAAVARHILRRYEGEAG